MNRRLVIKICGELELTLNERNLSLSKFYTADEVFASGTMGELTPVIEIDGRIIINRAGKNYDKTERRPFSNPHTLTIRTLII